MKYCILLATTLPFLAAIGCTTRECTEEYRYHTITVTRDVATTSEIGALGVEGCVEGHCQTGIPDASGNLTFESDASSWPPFEGSITSAGDPGKWRVTLRFSVGEGRASDTTELTLRVKRGDETLLEEKATVQWSNDDCHPTPKSLQL